MAEQHAVNVPDGGSSPLTRAVRNKCGEIRDIHAVVEKLVDSPDLKSGALKSVSVQVRPAVFVK